MLAAVGGFYEGQYWAIGRAGATKTSVPGKYSRRRVNIEAVPLVEGEDDHGGLLYALANGKKHGIGKRVWVSGARYVTRTLRLRVSLRCPSVCCSLPALPFRVLLFLAVPF